MAHSAAAARPAVFSAAWTVVCVLLLGIMPFLSVEGEDVVIRVGGWRQAVPGACLFKTVTGVDCPFCGLSRGFVYAAHLRLGQALRHNGASLPALVLVLFYALGGAFQHGFRGRARPLPRTQEALSAFKLVLGVAVAGGWLLKILSSLA